VIGFYPLCFTAFIVIVIFLLNKKGEKMSYIDDDEVQEKVRVEIENMTKELKDISKKAKEGSWDLEAETEIDIIIIEKALVVINYYRSKI